MADTPSTCCLNTTFICVEKELSGLSVPTLNPLAFAHHW